jgi:meiotically up-regulated gene 157 (Mug157) protein
VYEATRRRIFSPRNRFYFSGPKLTGLGSPHTSPRFVWPLAHAVEALTTSDASRQASLLQVSSYREVTQCMSSRLRLVDRQHR